MLWEGDRSGREEGRIWRRRRLGEVDGWSRKRAEREVGERGRWRVEGERKWLKGSCCCSKLKG